MTDEENAEKWIPVTERLPESGKRVLFAWMNDYTPSKRRISMGFYALEHTLDADYWEDIDLADYVKETDSYFCPEGWYEDMWGAEYFLSASKVTHWMPQPTQPEG